MGATNDMGMVHGEVALALIGLAVQRATTCGQEMIRVWTVLMPSMPVPREACVVVLNRSDMMK